uniref:Uncharacterized protein n=1 Tax=Panagrolaimus sp. JU765 TaxID=591449 RepID=A0AC34RN78_9BILA
MSAILAVIVLAVVLYIIYDIDKTRKQNGLSRVPFFGYVFDNVNLNVKEEIMDDGKDPDKKKKHHHKRKHSKRKTNKNEEETGKTVLAIGSEHDVEMVDDKTQKSDKKEKKATAILVDGKDMKTLESASSSRKKKK